MEFELYSKLDGDTLRTAEADVKNTIRGLAAAGRKAARLFWYFWYYIARLLCTGGGSAATSEPAIARRYRVEWQTHTHRHEAAWAAGKTRLLLVVLLRQFVVSAP